MNKELPQKYQELYEEILPILKNGRPGDDTHSYEVALSVLEYGKNRDIDFDVLVPVALMHDIGHSMILPEHFHYVTGPEKLINGKLVHMLVGAKIASNILEKVNYPKDKREEIIEIISMHDSDQLKINKSNEEIFDTLNKRFFHDIDSLDRYSIDRIQKLQKMNPSSSFEDILKMIDKITMFFFDDIRTIAHKKLQEIKDELKIS